MSGLIPSTTICIQLLKLQKYQDLDQKPIVMYIYYPTLFFVSAKMVLKLLQ